MKKFFQKMKGTDASPPKYPGAVVARAILGSAIALILIEFLQVLLIGVSTFPLFMAPLGASAALVFGTPQSPLAQPRNVIGGHAIAALVGVTAYKLAVAFNLVVGGAEVTVTGLAVLVTGLAVALAVGLMLLTGLFHAPGGATAFLAVAGGHVGGQEIHDLGYLFVLFPCMAGSVLMIAVALVFNNLPSRQSYPLYW
jgi:CBS-domain-containing membrane protein